MRVILARRGLKPFPIAVATAVKTTAVCRGSSAGAVVQRASVTLVRHCSSTTTSSSSGTSRDPARDGYDQFQRQQRIFHRHSFYEKGSAAPQGHAGTNTDEEKRCRDTDSRKSDCDHSSSPFTESPQQSDGKARVYGKGSATAQQRRQVSQQWEKSFFGRWHYERGMHTRFEEAFQSEEEEGDFRKRMAGQSHAQLFPNWPEDEEAPLREFKQLRPSLQLQYIIHRLSSGERRIRYAIDFGSLIMMAQLNLGEMMVKEAEALLRELDWMNDEVAAKIEEIYTFAAKIKYDFDLD